ncbi:hypothetical protein OROGR_019765 [Orobanche gracilis]
MAIPISISILTRLTSLYLLLFSLYPFPVSSLNITDLLSADPDYSNFTSLLTATSVAADLSSRSFITLLVVPNHRLLQAPTTSNLSDVLRYHVLLEYLSSSDFRRISPAGRLVTTLFQTTGRANDISGSVNITRNSSSGTVTFQSVASKSHATLLSLNRTLGHNNVSILSLDSLLIPNNSDLMASETQPPPGLNITKALMDGHVFNIAAAMLTASGVVPEFEADEAGAGITLFVPTDTAFSDLPSSVKFQSLAADQKAVVLKFHILHSYYPLGSLELIVNPIYPTLATEGNGAGRFTVNISRVNGSVAIDTGIVLASITQTVLEQNPVAIFGVSKVLLPVEYFGGGGVIPSAQPPNIAAVSPETSPETYGPSSHLLTPPGPEMSSAVLRVLRIFIVWRCVVFCSVLLL